MNDPVFWRLVWKEYRLQRALWISMAVLTVVVQLLVLAFTRDAVDRVPWLFTIGLALPAFYALGCGATLFATEHETGTYGFQRALPVSAARLLGSKVALACVSTAALIGLLWLVSVILAGWRLPLAEAHLQLWGLWGLAAVELLVWGIFFSLLSTRPLLAAILAVTAASVSVHLAAGGPGPWIAGEAYLAAVPLRAAVAGLVGLVDVWLGCRWFREQIVAYGGVARLVRRETASEETMDVSGGIVFPARTVLGRLLWQQWRQSARMIAALSALVAPAVLLLGWYAIRRNVSATGISDPAIMILALAAAPLMGACVFLADQRRHGYRFLAQHGARPTHVWLSRHLVWAAAVLLLATAVVLLLATAVISETTTVPLADLLQWRSPDATEILVGFVCLSGFVVLAYASGQLCSMFLQSGILAGFLSLVLSVVLCGWVGLMLFLRVPLVWSVAPIPLVFFLATWLRTRDWLLDRNCFRAWLRPGLALIVPAVAVLTAVPLYRVYEVPAVDPGFSPEQYARPASAEARATADMYLRAMDLYVPMMQSAPAEDKDVETSEVESEAARTARRAAWLEANEEALALTLEASRRAACDCYDPNGTAHFWADVYDLAWLILRSAEELESHGELDAALQRYLAALRVSVHMRPRTLWPHGADYVESMIYRRLPSWAARPNQTAERIATAIDQLGKLTGDLPSRSDAIKSEYLRMRRIISADPYALANELDLSRPEKFWAAFALQWLPWERARAVRVLNLITARELKSFREVESAILEGTEFEFPHYPRDDQQWLAFGSSTPSLAACYWAAGAWQARALASMETDRRAVRLLLALQAWKIEHGELPNTLDELVGPYLDRLPVDPYSAEPFRYFPAGVPIPLNLDPHAVKPEIFEAGTPFIWSAGPEVKVSNRDEPPPDRYLIRASGGKWREPTSEYDVWQSGRLFPLP
jgi:hypothetical protein